jgi:hypothetical protein
MLSSTHNVADPHHIDADPDPDPACHFYVDTDPTFYYDADLDPSFQINDQNLEKGAQSRFIFHTFWLVI